MKLVVAAVRPTPILWRRASGLGSPTEVPASTLPARGIAPVRANIASRSVVLPLWNGPTSAMHRGPRGLLTSCPIAASFIWSSALDWVGRFDAPPTSGIWQAGKTSVRRIVSYMARSPQGAGPTTRHCERSEAIQRAHAQTGLLRRFAPRNDGKTNLIYRPRRSSRLSSPAATLRPTWPCTLSGCSAIEFAEPPTSTLPPSPTPTDALPCAPA